MSGGEAASFLPWAAQRPAAQRTLDGLRAAEAQGRRGGRPAAVNDDVLAIARARQSRGESVTAIARHLKIGRSTLYRALEVEHAAAAGHAAGEDR